MGAIALVIGTGLEKVQPRTTVVLFRVAAIEVEDEEATVMFSSLLAYTTTMPSSLAPVLAMCDAIPVSGTGLYSYQPLPTKSMREKETLSLTEAIVCRSSIIAGNLHENRRR
ncbi:hypothetical protein ACH5RR_023296 [Cinchona calisaya]|uniref:Uncharacterized protein n=1 Tax=Cinchona calisaya TaxID=153742 RepID=A0ABD2ZBD5_9GENT